MPNILELFIDKTGMNRHGSEGFLQCNLKKCSPDVKALMLVRSILEYACAHHQCNVCAIEMV